MTKMELLQYAIDNGILDETQIALDIEMKKREERLKAHPYQIFQGKDGKWRTYFPDKKKGRVQRVRNTKEEIEDLVVDFQKSQDKSPTIREIFNDWNDRRLSLKQIATSTFVRNQHIFNKHFDSFGNKKIAAAGIYDWCEFMEEQVPRFDMTAKAFANFKGIAKGIIQRAKRLNYIDYTFSAVESEIDDDFSFRRVVKKDNEEVYDEAETELLMNYLATHQDTRNLAILLIFVTGMRVGEVVALKQKDLSDNTIFVNRTESSYKLNHKLTMR